MEDVCRICYERNEEGSRREPLKHPCRCSGSVAGVHESCLLRWISGHTERERCEICTTPYQFKTNRPTELVDQAQRICESIVGNIGPHIFVQYGIVAILIGQIGNSSIRLRDICFMQAAYHLTFLALLGVFIKKRIQGPMRAYLYHAFNFERTLYLSMYIGLWTYLLALKELMPMWLLVDIALQVFLPAFPYLHLQVVKEMNAGQRRVLLDYGMNV